MTPKRTIRRPAGPGKYVPAVAVLCALLIPAAADPPLSIERLIDLGRLEEARKRLPEASGGRALLLEAMLLFREGRPEESLRKVNDYLRVAPESPDAHKLAALNLVALGKKELAGPHIQQAVRLAPADFMAHYYLGMYQLEVREREAAERAFQAAIRLNPLYSDSHTMLGYALEQLGREPEALACYRRAVELVRLSRGQKESAHLYLARFLISRQQHQDAAPVLEEAVRFNPKSVEGWQLLGRARTALGQFDSALLALERAVTLAPAEKRTRYFLMQVYQRMGRTAEARREREIYERISASESGRREERVMGAQPPP
jgi:tetratricopeptide (TPR) repeat protein